MSDVEPTMNPLGRIIDQRAERDRRGREQVEPRFKGEPAEKEPRRALPRMGKKARTDAKELRVATLIVHARSGGLCEIRIAHDCTRVVDCPPHHVRRRSQGGTNAPENLLDVCTVGHRWIHDNPAQARFAGLLA